MPALITSNFDGASIKDERATMDTPFSHYKSIGIFRCSNATYSVVSGSIWPKFELVRDFMHVVFTIFPIVIQWGLSGAMDTRAQLFKASLA